MIASGFGFTVYLILAKMVSSEVHPVVLAFFRSLIGFLVVAPILVRQGPRFLASDNYPTLFIRSLLGTLGFVLSLVAVSDFFTLPLSQFNALSFSRPLFVTLLAALVLREAVGAQRWGAVAVGFLGVMVMVVPGVIFFWLPEGAGPPLDWGAVLAIASAFAFAGAIVLVKSLTASHSPMQLLVWANMLSTILLLPAVFFFWTNPDPMSWLLIIGMSLTGLGAQFCYITAMSMGDASFLSPMDYLRLPMAAVADFLLFRLLPGMYVWIGAGIIVAATLFIAWRESRRRPHPPDLPGADRRRSVDESKI